MESNFDLMSAERLVGWRGYDWVLAPGSTSDAKVWTPVTPVTEETYQENLAKFGLVFPQSVARVRQIFPALPALNIQLAVFPHGDFRQHTGLTDRHPQWIAGCVRDGRLCYDHTKGRRYGHDFSDLPVRIQSGELHEISHPVLQLAIGRSLPLTLWESLPEIIPHFLLDLQTRWPESTQYLVTQLPGELVSPADIDKQNDMFAFSSSQMPENRGYMSAAMFSLGVIQNLDADLFKGFHKLLALIKSTPDSQLYPAISAALKYDLNSVLDGRDIQLQAISYVKDKYSFTHP